MTRAASIWVVFFTSVGFFLIAMLPGEAWFDSTELTQGAYFLDSTHPPGQPLYISVGKLLTFLPLGSIAFRTNLLSALSCAGAIAVASLLLTRGPSLFLAALFALVLSMHPTMALQGVRSEVYGLHLIIAILVIVLMQWRLMQQRAAIQQGWLLPLFLFGLGLANHHFLTLLLLPFILVHALLLKVPRGRKLQLALWGIFFMLAGLSLYLFLPVRSHSQQAIFSWGAPTHFVALIHMLAGRDYQVFFLPPWRDWAPFLKAVTTVRLEIIVAALIAFYLLLRARQWQTLLLLLAVASTLPAFLVRAFNPENPDAQGYIAMVPLLFYVVVFMVVQERKAWVRAACIGICFLFAVQLVIRSPDPIVRHSDYLVEEYVQDLEANAPYGALFFLSSDHAIFPMVYSQNVFRARPDLRFISPLLGRARWYHDYLRRRYPDLDMPPARRGWLAALLETSRRPLFAEQPKTLRAGSQDPGGPQSIQPWYHWYRLHSSTQPQQEVQATIASSFFQQAYTTHPQRYRMTARKIRDLIYVTRGNFYYRQGDLAAATHQLELAVNHEPLPAIVRRSERVERSILPMHRRRHPVWISEPADNLYLLGSYYMQAAEVEAARSVFAEAAAAGNPNGMLLLADLALRQGDAGKAVRLIQRIPNDFPEKPLALGIAYLRQGDFDLAERFLRQGSRRLPEDIPSRLYLSRIERTRGNFTRARALVEELLQQHPDNPQILHELETLERIRSGREGG